jgi:hypothetical protein
MARFPEQESIEKRNSKSDIFKEPTFMMRKFMLE